MNPRPIPQREPRPQPQPQPAPRPALAKAALGLALAAGLAVVALPSLLPAASDRLSEAEVRARAQAFAAAGPLTLAAVPMNDRAQREALASLGLPAAAEQRLIEQFALGSAVPVWVELWDDVAEDGDVVALATPGFRVEVPLRHAPVRVVVPLSPHFPQLTLTGVRDGGGGITVAVRTARGAVPLPRLAPGQTLRLPIRGFQ